MKYRKHFAEYVDKYVASIRAKKRGNADIDRLRVKLIHMAVDRLSTAYVEELLHIAESRSLHLCVDQTASVDDRIRTEQIHAERDED